MIQDGETEMDVIAREVRICRGVQIGYANALLDLFEQGRLRPADITERRERELRELAIWLRAQHGTTFGALADHLVILADAAAADPGR